MGDTIDPRGVLFQGATALSTALFVAAFGWAVTRMFALNFSVAGPNATLVLVLLFVTGWTIPVAARADERWPDVSLALVAIAALSTVVSLFVPMVPALFAAILVMVALTPPVAALVGRLGGGFAVGAATGVALLQFVRAAQDSVPASGLLPGNVALVVCALALVGAWLALYQRDAVPAVESVASPVSGVGAFVLAQAVFLGSAATVARWTLPPEYLLVTLASAGGLLAGGAVVALAPRVRESPTWVLLAVGAFADLLWLRLFVIPSVLAAQAAAVVMLGSICRRSESDVGPSPLRAGGALALVQFAGVFVSVLYPSSVNAPFMPEPLRSLGGLETSILFSALAILPLVTLVAWIRGRETEPEQALASADRRALLGVAGAAVATAGAAIFQEQESPDSAGSGDEIRAMTYNVHRYLSATGGGAVSLEAIASVIRGQNPHLVGLQETEGTRFTTGAFDGLRWLADKLGYHAVDLTPGDMDTFGVALLSRWPIVNARLERLPVVNSPPRLALVAEVERENDRLPVIVTHFSTSSEGPLHRNDLGIPQSRKIEDFAREFDRAVVLGDFNVKPDPEDPVYERLNDTFTDAWAAADTEGDGFTWTAADPDRRIDYVFLHGDWEVVDATVSGRPEASDHLAVTATVREP
jgi:endonuclease/exonuclease/phosphatase family metal-dependent hydrolase